MNRCRNPLGRLGLTALLVTRTASAGVVSLEELEAKAVERRGATAAADRRVARASAEIDLARSAYAPSAALSVEASGAPGGRLVGVRDSGGTELLVAGSRRIGEPDAFVPLPRYGAVLSIQARLYDFGHTRAGVLAAVAAKALVNVRISTAQGLENGNPWCEGGMQRLRFAAKRPRPP